MTFEENPGQARTFSAGQATFEQIDCIPSGKKFGEIN
jgi:hypothetical protein